MNVKFEELIRSFWADLPLRIFDRFQSQATIRTYKKGDVILRQDTPNTGVGFIVKGKAEGSAYSNTGVKVWIADYKPGELYGHITSLSNEMFTFEVAAKSDMAVLRVSSAEFSNMLEENSILGCDISTEISKSATQCRQRIFEMITLSAPGRIYAELIRLSYLSGTDKAIRVIRPAPIHSQLARRVTSTRETVSRTINQLQKSGIIDRHPGAVIIKKYDLLEKKMDAALLG